MSTHTTEEKPSLLTGKETRTAIILGLGFLTVFTSYASLQNLQGSLNDESGLGVISLSCLYAAAILSAIYAPTVITAIGERRSVLMAFTVHIVYVSSNFYPSFYTLVPSSILLGAVTGPLWTSLGTYLTSCALSYSKMTNMDVFTSLSRINGIFFSMFELNFIVGNLLSSLVLYQGDYNVTMTNSTYFCGTDDCPDHGETSDIIADPEDYVVYILLGIFLACVATGLVTVLIFLTPLQRQHTTKSDMKKSLGSWFRLIYDTDIKCLLPIFFYMALEQVVSYTEITKSFVSCPIGIQNMGYVMSAYGVCTTTCTFTFSRITKYTRRYILISMAATIQMALMLWMYHWVPTSQDVIKIYILASLWGVAEGIWKPQTNVVLGDIFSENKQSAFAVFEGTKSIGFTATFVYSSLICMKVKLIIAMVTLAVGMILYGFVEIRFAKKGRKTESIDYHTEGRGQKAETYVEKY